MVIGKIWDADYPWDIRVEKVVNSLVSAGHIVHLVCRNDARRARYEERGDFVIHRLPSLPNPFERFHRLINFPFPLNPVWIWSIAQTIKQAQIDLILIRDIPLALPAAILGKVFRIPIVLDMAENYPAMLEDRLQYTPTGPLGRIIRCPVFARITELIAIRLADHIIVVIEESRERLIKEGVRPHQVSVVSNTPRIDCWDTMERPTLIHQESEQLALVYLGNLDGSRGVDVAIRAVKILKDKGKFVRFSVVGDGPNFLKLRDLVKELGISDQVRIMGRLPFSQVQLIMSQSHIGLIPHYATAAWNNTIPNKLFDYMLLGLPVIASEAIPTARIVRATGCGLVFQDRDPSDLAHCISALGAPQLRSQMGAAGRAAIKNRYHWEYDANVLVQSINSMATTRYDANLKAQ